MKKNRILKIGLLALALTLVTASLVSGTFAKYVTTVTGTGTVQVAKWKVQVGPNATYGMGTETDVKTFDLLNTVLNNTDVADTPTNLIAPGTNGSFSLAYNTVGSQVDHSVTITLKNTSTNKISDLANLTFTYTDGAGTPQTKTAEQMAAADGVVIFAKDLDDAGEAKVVTINWTWPIGPADLTAQDNIDDTADGEDAKSFEFTATFDAVQLDNDPIT